MRQRTVSIEQVEGTLEQWIRAANRGETVLITRAGSAVAALVGPPDAHGRPLADPVPVDPDLIELLGWGDEEALRYLADC